MSEIIKELSLTDMMNIAHVVQLRQMTMDETLEQSIVTTLVLYGQKFVPVSCIGGEWSGLKQDLPPTEGIPKCPNGHVLMEAPNQISMALVKKEA
jgi:hypothetical protein